MSYKVSIRLRAFFLLLVFYFNTIMGFACAIGVDMNFNTFNHAEMEISCSGGHSHDYSTQTCHHSEAADSHNGGNEDDCCSDDIVKLIREEKNIAKLLTIDRPVYTCFYSAPYNNLAISLQNNVKRHTRYFVRNYHPPIPDIRIAIQSFQI